MSRSTVLSPEQKWRNMIRAYRYTTIFERKGNRFRYDKTTGNMQFVDNDENVIEEMEYPYLLWCENWKFTIDFVDKYLKEDEEGKVKLRELVKRGREYE